MTPYTITKIKLDGTDIKHKGLISQLRPVRIGRKMMTKEMVAYCPNEFGSSSNLSAIEHNRQTEKTEQLIAYARKLGVKEITIIL
jgi:hypothetical protein